ncbi:MAG: hypothetical protein ACF8TS_17555, partial [Maioricimonas sp. JB049]
LAAVTFAVAQFWQLAPRPFSRESWSMAAFSIAVPLLILVRHRENLKRLFQGTEKRFSSRPAARQSAEPDGAP